MTRRFFIFAGRTPRVTDEERQSVAQYIASIRLLLEDERSVALRFRRVLAQAKDERPDDYGPWVLAAAGYFREHSRELARRFWELPSPAHARKLRSSWGEYYSALVACFVTAPAAIDAVTRAPYETWMADEYEFSKLGRVYERAGKRAWRQTRKLAKQLDIDLDEAPSSV